MLQLLTAVLDHNGDPTYADADVRAHATTVIALATGGLLAVRESSEKYSNHVQFIVFEFTSSDIGGANTMWSRVFHGEGFSGELRELRHSHWGEADNGGYIFYPNGELIADAFAQLGRWFDCGNIPVSPEVEAIAKFVAGDGTDAQRIALADAIREGRHGGAR